MLAGDVQLVHMLLDRGADPNAKGMVSSLDQRMTTTRESECFLFVHLGALSSSTPRCRGRKHGNHRDVTE